MTAIHTIKFTRNSIEHPWPYTAFFKQWWESYILRDFYDLQSPNYKANAWHPLSIQNNVHRWHFLPGFVDYNYSEYDPMTDIKAEELIKERNDNFDLVTIDRKLTYNPSALTLTENITFDTLDNLKSFLRMANEHWTAPTKEEVFNYLAEKGMMVSEETKLDGVVSNDTIKLFG